MLQFYVFRFSCMLECHKSLYFCLIRGLHGILSGVVCSPNYSWVSSACPSSQTCQMCILKIKQLAFLPPTCHVYAPRVQLGVSRRGSKSSLTVRSRNLTVPHVQASPHLIGHLMFFLNPCACQHKFPEVQQFVKCVFNKSHSSPPACSLNLCLHHSPTIFSTNPVSLYGDLLSQSLFDTFGREILNPFILIK